MRALAVALILAISVPGCAMTSQQKSVGYTVGGVATALGIAALIAMLQPCEETGVIEVVGCGVATIQLYTIGVLLGGVGVATIGVTAASPTLEVPDAAPSPEIERAPNAQVARVSKHSVGELTEQASIAARIGRCGTVAAIADRVELLDPSYRFKGFVADAAIAGCLP